MLSNIRLIVTFSSGNVITKNIEPNNSNGYSRKDVNNIEKWKTHLLREPDVIDVILVTE